MARSKYIYTVTIDNSIVWIGTVKHEMETYMRVSRYDARWLLWVSRYKDGSQEGIDRAYRSWQAYLEDGGKF